MDIRQQFDVKCWAGKYGDDWVVLRKRDEKVMTQGSVFTCCRWVVVWGPMNQ